MLKLHIVAFDTPWPADYGGVIDVYYKLKALKEKGVSLTLHCYTYGRKEAKELSLVCDKVYYYQRKTGLIKQLSSLPYNVTTRKSKELVSRLKADNAPILLEVLHTCWLMNEPELKGRSFIYRHSNIEHDYFRQLAHAEKNFIKKLYLSLEAVRLKRFEHVITSAKIILAVNQEDVNYFKQKYPQQETIYLPSFHPSQVCTSKLGQGNYLLFHGNLSISENYQAAIWLIRNVFSKSNFPTIIAGKNAPTLLSEEIAKYSTIELINNPDDAQMNTLIENAQVHCLYTGQSTGLKLKLLNVLFKGRFIVLNPLMTQGTGIQANESLFIANQPDEFIAHVENCMKRSFDTRALEERINMCQPFTNESQTTLLVECIKRLQ